MMLSNHYPLSFGAQYNWVISGLIFLMGVTIRHYFNMSHAGRIKPYWAWVVTCALFISVVLMSTIKASPTKIDEMSSILEKPLYKTKLVRFEDVSEIIVSRCAMCHAAEPLWDGFISPPGGVVLETDHDIVKNAKAIYLYSGIDNYMPPNNISYMEPEERKLIVKWFEEAF